MSLTADHPLALFDAAASYRVDAAAIAGGTSGFDLMLAAGRAVAAVAMTRPPVPVLVLCGPGQNGGDGFVVAHALADAVWPVRLALHGDRNALTGDAARAASLWNGPIEPAIPSALFGAGLIIDGLFGCGLNRPLTGSAFDMVQAVNQIGVPVIAIDLPSGIHADSGQIMGAAIRADITVAFARARPGHLINPGRRLSGQVIVADIGHSAQALLTAGACHFKNDPALWPALASLYPTEAAHKYSRGQVLVAVGRQMTGAGILAAAAAGRAGAGIVTLMVPAGQACPVSPAQMLQQSLDPITEWSALPMPKGPQAIVFGPGLGISANTRRRAEAVLALKRDCVLDADALSVFAADPACLFRRSHARLILTPHIGEFKRLFPDLDGTPVQKAQAAAQRAGCCVLLKGPETVIADETGQVIIQPGAPSSLALAGSGDVLAGTIAAMLAQQPDLPALLAAAAGVWLHAQAAEDLTPGFTAGELADALPNARHVALRWLTAP